MGYDQYSVPDTVAVELLLLSFILAIVKISTWPLEPFLQISLKNGELKTNHNTFRDCRMCSFRQPFCKGNS